MHHAFDLPDDLARVLEIVSVDFHVDGFLRPKAGDSFDEPARIEKHRDARKELEDLGPHVVHDLHLVSCPFVRRDEMDGDARRMGAGVRIEQGGTALGQYAGTGHDGFQFLGRDLCPQHPFDLGHLLLGFLHSLTDRSAQDDAELAFVRHR